MILTLVIRLFRTPIIRGFLLLLIVGACNSEAKNNSDTIVQSTVAAPLPADTSNDNELQQYFETLSKQGKFNGVALLSSKGNVSTVLDGFRLKSEGDSLQLNDQFQLASLSKPITSLGLLCLVNESKVNLDDPVVNYLWDFPYLTITVRSLLNHTSGMGNYIYVTDSLWNNPDSFMTNRDVYELLRCEQVPTYYPPFKRFDYCNTNYAVIPILIEEVSGLPFQEFMRVNVFEPLGMFSTYYYDPNEVLDYSVQGHYPDGSSKKPFYLDAVLGDKSLYSSVFDLYKLFEELKQPTLIEKELLDEAMSIEAKTGVDSYYGLGWRIKPLNDGDTLVYHNGWWRGFRSYFWMSKKQDKVAIILTNSIRGGYLNRQEIWNLF
jgi:CubicO group peptidase (beta-lactamase class C family)